MGVVIKIPKRESKLVTAMIWAPFYYCCYNLMYNNTHIEALLSDPLYCLQRIITVILDFFFRFFSFNNLRKRIGLQTDSCLYYCVCFFVHSSKRRVITLWARDWNRFNLRGRQRGDPLWIDLMKFFRIWGCSYWTLFVQDISLIFIALKYP